jgi:LPXTG-site transpeptidase (sortase) family protein
MLSTNILKKKLPLILCSLGVLIFCLGAYLYFFKDTDSKGIGQKVVNQEKKEDSLHSEPFAKRLIISGVKIDLPIIENKIIDGVWETTQEGVSHLDVSANPKEGGNIVLYGHNKRILLGSLPYVSMGAGIELIDEDGNSYKYKVYEKKLIDTTDVSIALATPSERLTIYTCDEVEEGKRFVLFARPVD